MKEVLKCFHCSKDPCCCSLPEVDLKKLKREVQRRAFNGGMLDKMASGYCVAWLIQEIERLQRAKNKYANLAQRSRRGAPEVKP